MKVNTTINGNVLTATVEGSVDSVTAPELENTLESQWDGITELILDFAGVKFLSSAGLRVIMRAEKRMKGKLILRNVSENAKEVFEITGLARLFMIEP